MLLVRSLLSVLIAALCAATPALSQTATAPEAHAVAAAVARPSCTKPGEHPGPSASDDRRKGWQREVDTYAECLKRYIEDQKAIANAHVRAANSAIDTFNAHMAEFKEQLRRAAGGI
jgi:hypothetical protein